MLLLEIIEAIMHATVRKIGNSKGVIIPSALINQLHIESEVEMTLENNALVIRPIESPRKGWFDNYNAEQDTAPLAEMNDLASEQEDWEW